MHHAVTGAGGLNGERLNVPFLLVDHQGGKRFGFNGVRKDDEALAADRLHCFERGNYLLRTLQLAVRYQDEGRFYRAVHAVRIGDEVRREIAFVPLHAFHVLSVYAVHASGLFDHDDGIPAEGLNDLTDEGAHVLVQTHHAGEPLDLLAGIQCLCERAYLVKHYLSRAFDAFTQRHRIVAYRHRFVRLVEDRLSDHRGCGGAVAGLLADVPRQVANEHGAHVFKAVRQLDNAASDGSAVIHDFGRRSPLGHTFKGYCTRLWPQRNLKHVCHNVESALEGLASFRFQ